MSQVLSPMGEALHFLKLTSVFYCKSQILGNHGVAIPEIPGTSMFHIVTEGHCQLECNHQTYHLEPGDFIFLPKGQGHLFKYDEDSKVQNLFDIYREQISPSYETLFLGDSGLKTTILCGVIRLDHPSADLIIDAMPEVIHIQSSKAPYSSWMNQTVRLIAEEAEQTQLGGETVLTRLADVMVIQALRHWINHQQDEQSGWLSALRDARIGKSLALIHKHPEIAWTLELLGKEIGMSRTAFANRFSELVGEPMLQYLTKWRINIAKMKLRDGEKVTLDFVEQLGYKSESAFRRTFKKLTGQNISEYLENTKAQWQLD